MTDAAPHASFHDVLPEAVLAAAVGAPGPRAAGAAAAAVASPDVLALEEHAAAGCSLCARALVNAREALLDLAVAAGAPAPPPALRDRVLSSARASAASPAAEGAPPRQGTPDIAGTPRDPSATVAHAHLAGADEAARLAEADRIGGWEPHENDGLDAILEEAQRALGFPVLFVSIVRGERVGYRAQRGLPPALAAQRDMRREATFCTHCVAGDRPLIVRDAAGEAFFRNSKMVTRFGVRAYVGVPLRTLRGVTVGTLCALDFAPRDIGASEVGALERVAPRVAAAIDRGDGGSASGAAT